MQKIAERLDNEETSDKDDREESDLPDVHLSQQTLAFLELVKDGEDHPGGKAEDIIPHVETEDEQLLRKMKERKEQDKSKEQGSGEEEKCKKLL